VPTVFHLLQGACTFEAKARLTQTALHGVWDLEDLVRAGKATGGCGYYASRGDQQVLLLKFPLYDDFQPRLSFRRKPILYFVPITILSMPRFDDLLESILKAPSLFLMKLTILRMSPEKPLHLSYPLTFSKLPLRN
jgi:hypothetical protein